MSRGVSQNYQSPVGILEIRANENAVTKVNL
jgi:hypothetical protein